MKKILSFALAVLAVFGLTACGDKKTTEGNTTTDKPAPTDESVYNAALKDYEALIEAAKAETDLDKKYALYAKAEA